MRSGGPFTFSSFCSSLSWCFRVLVRHTSTRRVVGISQQREPNVAWRPGNRRCEAHAGSVQAVGWSRARIEVAEADGVVKPESCMGAP